MTKSQMSSNVEPDCWHSVVRITQVPGMNRQDESEVSWLCDPLGGDKEKESIVYCTKFTLDKGYFSWKFYLKEETRRKAIESGFCFLEYLQELYPGLDGIVKVKPIYLQQIRDDGKFSELILPEPPYRKKIDLIKKIVNLFCNLENYKVKIFVFWQRSDDVVGEISDTVLEKKRKRIEDYYKVKIFINSVPSSPDADKKEDLKTKFKGHLRSLTSGISNEENDRAKIQNRPSLTSENIANFLVFFKNRDKLDTGLYYRNIKDVIGEAKLPGFVNAKTIDFTIPKNFLLPQAKKIFNENIEFSSSFKNELLLGYWIRNGVKKNKPIYLKFDDLLHHFFVSGLSGSGKSRFLYHFKKELMLKAPHVGVMIINLKKKGEKQYYNADINLEYKDLEVPYTFIDEEEGISDTLESFIPLLVASLGFAPFVEHPFVNSTKAYYDEHHTLPTELKDLFPPLVHWFKNQVKYDDEISLRTISAIENRVIRLLNSPVLKKIVRLRKDIPTWFSEWKNGKDVFIDLTGCKSTIKKRLIMLLIFQMISKFTPELNELDSDKKIYGNLQHVIMLDEIGDFLAVASSPIYSDDEHLARHYVNEKFGNFLGVFRSRGVCLAYIDNKPSRLFESVYSLPSIKMVFRTAHSCNHLFTKIIEEQEFLKGLEHRRAMVIDGVNGYKYEIYTPDFDYPNFNTSRSD